MHEMGLADSTLEMVLQASAGKRVKRVRVHVGKCLLVVPDSFSFSFELAATETDAEGASLEIEEVLPRIRCRHCNHESETTSMPYLCGSCSSPDVEIVAGEEIRLEEIELEDGTVLRDRRVAAAQSLADHFREYGPHDH